MVTLPSSVVHRFDHTNGSVPDDVLDILHAYAARANIILPHMEKVFNIQAFSPPITSKQLWLVYSQPSGIKFVLSCTEGPMGKYPIFIVPTVPVVDLSSELLEDSMDKFCDALLNESEFSTRRVFSVFSDEKVTEAFTDTWERRTGVNRIAEPYYKAILTTCSRETLALTSLPLLEGMTIELRLAIREDAQKISTLCHEFAATSPPFLLCEEDAVREADILIDNKQVWVLEIQNSDGQSDIASIVAVTRKSKDVAAITKVYTPDTWRGKRFAERLVRRVCRELLKTYEQVVLYVGVDNPAKVVYGRVGFPIPTEGSPIIDGVENWLEIGFDRAEVELGHW